MLRSPHNPTAYSDDWEGQPAQSGFHQWILGLVVPVAIAGYGITGIVRQQITFSQQNADLTLHGPNAIAFGTAWIAAGLFLHCHYFWGNIYDGAWFAVLGKIVAAIVFIGGLGSVLWRNGVMGIQ